MEFQGKTMDGFLSLGTCCNEVGQRIRATGYESAERAPKCARRIDGEDAWESDRNDTEIFYLLGWDVTAWEEELVIMQESGLLD